LDDIYLDDLVEVSKLLENYIEMANAPESQQDSEHKKKTNEVRAKFKSKYTHLIKQMLGIYNVEE